MLAGRTQRGPWCTRALLWRLELVRLLLGFFFEIESHHVAQANLDPPALASECLDYRRAPPRLALIPSCETGGAHLVSHTRQTPFLVTLSSSFWDVQMAWVPQAAFLLLCSVCQ